MKKNGFTLLEMIVVMMVVATLFILTIPNVSKVINSVDDKACDALTKVVDAAIVQYKLEHGSYPNSIGELSEYLSDDQMYCKNGKGISIIDGHATHD